MSRFRRSMGARSTLRRRSGARLRPVEWRVSPSVNFSVNPGESGFTVLANDAVLSEFTSPTIVRIRGTIWVAIDNANAGGVAEFFLGICVVDTVQVDELAVPSPFVDGDGNRWMYWHGDFGQGDSSSVDGLNRFRIPVDVRSMRRVAGENQQLVLVCEVLTGGNVVSVYNTFRLLIKE